MMTQSHPSTNGSRKVLLGVATLVFASFLTSYGWLWKLAYQNAVVDTRQTTDIEAIVGVNRQWDSGHSLDKRITTLESQVAVISRIDERMGRMEERINGMNQTLGKLANDMEWMRGRPSVGVAQEGDAGSEADLPRKEK
jgi:hypothetical protein